MKKKGSPKNAAGKKDGAPSAPFPRELDVKLTPREKDAKRDRVLEAEDEADEEREALRKETAPRRTRIKELTEEAKRLRGEVKKGTEKRLVNCVSQKDYRANKVRVIRQDTRAVVEETDMTPDDRQEDLPEVPARSGKKGARLADARFAASVTASEEAEAGGLFGDDAA